MESLYCKQYHILNNLFEIKKKQPGSISFPLLMLIHPLYCKQYPIFNEFLEEKKNPDRYHFSLFMLIHDNISCTSIMIIWYTDTNVHLNL